MSIRVVCTTRFDITATGVKSHFNISRLPFQDATGRNIANNDDWNHARNQQRNWETINQIISLRTLPDEISDPIKTDQDGKNTWQFEFTVENPSTIELDGDPVGALAKDSNDVPMLLGLYEDPGIEPCLKAGINICFTISADK